MNREEDFETLRHLHNRQFDELQYRRARQYQIFTGTLLILLAMIGVLVQVPAAAFGHLIWPILGSVFVVLLVGFSLAWQRTQQRDTAEHARVIVDILERMGAFDEGPYPDEWRKWGRTEPSRRRALITVAIALTTLMAMWLKFATAVG